MTPLEKAVIKTLAYADIFQQALSHEELEKYLIGYKATQKDKLLEVKTHKVQRSDDLFTLNDRLDHFAVKSHQRQTTHDKRQTAQKYLWVFKLVPWVKMVAITGSVAGGTPKPDDDIDLLIITDPHRLWLTRLLVTLLLNLLGIRRKPHDHPSQVNNKLCLNMWLTVDNLAEAHHDLYTANELARIIPLLNRRQTYRQYILANPWLAKYLPNFYKSVATNRIIAIPLYSVSSILNPIDLLAAKMQRAMMKKQTIETVEQKRLAFHPHDYRVEILSKFQQRLKDLDVE